MCCFRNTATDAVKQELLFVGQESGKLLAMRNLVRKVRPAAVYVCVEIHVHVPYHCSVVNVVFGVDNWSNIGFYF